MNNQNRKTKNKKQKQNVDANDYGQFLSTLAQEKCCPWDVSSLKKTTFRLKPKTIEIQ
jgi:hypothetical protein